MADGRPMDIIVLPLYGIGDVLMATPALRNLKERTGARITCLHMFRTTKDVLERNPHVEENVHFPFLERGRLEGVRFLAGLRGNYDASMNFYPTNRKDYNLAAYIIRSPLRIGHRYGEMDLRGLNFLKNRTVMEDNGLHNVEEDLRLLGFLGIDAPEPYPLEIYLGEEEEEAASGWLRGRGLEGAPLMGFHPGSSLFKAHALKRWPAEKYAELIKALSARSPSRRFLLFGGPEEDGLKEEIRRGSSLPEKVVSVSTPGIRLTTAIMKRCGTFITNDSGLMHLAAALQVPTVAIFGPTNPRWLKPWKCEHRLLRHGSCPPCFRYSPTPQRCAEGGDFSCIRKIEVAEVLDAAISLGA